MAHHRRGFHSRLLCGAAAISLLTAAAAHAEDQTAFNIAPQPLSAALNEFGIQSKTAVLFTPDLTGARVSSGLTQVADADTALRQMLNGTGLSYRRNGDTFIIMRADDPQGGSAAGTGAGTVETLIVTAQKREEDIQDVPIAISAFTQEDLTRSQVAGGPDLMTQVPNMTFTKTNFSGYSIQIRGIGTQAISATTDPAVAVAFNNTPFIRNRFFEQEFYDLQRIEVLRGPQGTLYGRNATAGVVNIISAKPKFIAEAKLSADIGNFSSTRVEGMVNLPLVEDAVALRIAGAWTKRDGYATNQLTGNPIDGRDLWSTRVSLRFAPNDRIDANLIWEHFQENDDRLRSGKQLCKKDVVTDILAAGTGPGGVGADATNIPYFSPLPNVGQAGAPWASVQSTLSQGCERNSLYSPDSFQTPNGRSIPYYIPLGAIGLPIALDDPYVSAVQSQDLRVIESTVDPDYRAKSDLAELQISFDISDNLTLQSETSYSADTVFSQQDFNRFNTAPGAWKDPGSFARPGVLTPGPNGPIFCDPQIGCSDRLVAIDISTAKSRQFSQEFRVSSDYDGAFNFSLGANFLRYDTEDKYYVFINSLSLQAASPFGNKLFFKPYIPGVSDNSECLVRGPVPGDPSLAYSVTQCTYIDPNPIGSLNDEGHNYFLSKNPYKLISYAVFGEAYYQLADNLKVTAGLRWTVDKKEAPRVPSWLLASNSAGYPVASVTEQEWREPTGRLAIDWKPALSFTDETLLYASYAHGYKAGGANPPPYVRVFYGGPALAAISAGASETRPRTFDPEFVNAFEVGSKNTLADGRVTLNLAAFYYDYKDYQISEIVDRSAFNRNFDATVWGVEVETDWRPLENLRLGFKGGYEKTRIADGESAVDLMDRTAGHDDWVVVRPFPTFASSCILPAWLFAHEGPNNGIATPNLYGLGAVGGGGPGGCELAYFLGHDPVTNLNYTPNPTVQANAAGATLDAYWFPNTYPGFDPSTAPNGGEGFSKQLGGNELPNAPHWTTTFTGDYSLPLPNDWLMTLHSDVHWQSQSWWRVFNDHVYDKLHPYFTMNLAAIFTNEEAGWNIMAYIKNVTDETAITGAFLFSDDTGLTTNVFLTEPRLYGLRVTKAWSGGAWWNSDGRQHPAGEPYPVTVELGGQVQRRDAPYADIRPTFLDSFSSGLQAATTEKQDQDLDWGDGREVKLTYAVPGGKWQVSAGHRIGKTNRGDKFADSEFAGKGCLYGHVSSCDTDAEGFSFKVYNYVHGTVYDSDEFELIDFTVGRDVGLGVNGTTSRLSAGVRYAEFSSTTHLNMEGVPDWYIPPTNVFYYNHSQHHRYETDLQTDREFKGAGPVISWEVSKRLFGQDDNHVDLDATVEGGVLFGKQKTAFNGEELGAYYDGYRWYRYDLIKQVGPTVVTPAPANRSESVTVPTFGASLGLSYEIQRVKVGAGYRWERYSNVLDGGFDERKKEDRTIDGPYFKIAVGFGG